MSAFEKKTGDVVDAEDEKFIKSLFQFSFTIENFAVLKEKDGKINSPTFYGDPKHGDQWRVQFGNISKEWASATLQLVHSEAKEPIDATFQICLMDKMKKIKRAEKVCRRKFLTNPKHKNWDENFYIENLLDPQREWKIEGPLYFHIQVLTRRLKSELESEAQNQAFVIEQLKSLLIHGDHADVVLESEHSQFPASKIILAAQSPVFFAMFNSDMVESKSNAVVNIEEFSDDTVHGFLEFVYTGKTESLEENARELLKISDKYQVLSLKGKCERILLNNLNCENASDILILAHLYSPQKLKPQVIPFVNKHFNLLRNKEWFEKAKKEYPQLVFDLYEAQMKCKNYPF